ncbi:glycerophosphodiester phosphodiesterase family protein [Marivivens aquimaris]|uniref:glycerophosphodiester phosphodiesterase family protein n=1 Tax=Marivivens aquimaris TaxID=2774876 RepID=UPI001880133E|nr:glycerophosphodiester phosphodiesterase family protein [Marivivens aquimaris]
MLPRSFIDCPIAHRAFHDKAAGRPENSLAAIRAAVAEGYGIEIDLQLSKDGVAMVFHDYSLTRLTGENGPIAQRSAAELGQMTLLGGDEGVPTLAEVLEAVDGKVPLLIEIKDQDGALGPNVGALEEATAAVLKGYTGPVALMSFNPHSIAKMAELLPEVPRGLTTCNYAAEDWPTISAATRDALRGIPDYERTGSCFVSHQHTDLADLRIAELKAGGANILCWTIRSAEAEKAAREIADNVTFEGYRA